MTRGHFIISGLVQGVCFRIYANEEACKLGLTGWVRNLQTGDVEVVAEGDDDAVAALLSWCREGPSHANVTNVSSEYSEATGECEAFSIRY
jgi:acylphosphatase